MIGKNELDVVSQHMHDKMGLTNLSHSVENINVNIVDERIISDNIKKGDIAINNGKFKEAKKYYKIALEKSPKSWEILNRMGVANFNLRKHRKAIKYYNMILKEDIPGDLDKSICLNNKGNAFFHLKKYDDAVRCYCDALKISPNYDLIYYNIGIVYLDSFDIEKALQWFEKALIIDNNNQPAWYLKGLCYTYLSKDKEALMCYNQALKLNSNCVGAWVRKGIILTNFNKIEDSLYCYNKALECCEIEVEFARDKIYFRKANSYFLSKRFQKALNCYKKAIVINNKNDKAWIGQGFASLQLGHKKEAEKSFNVAGKLNGKLFPIMVEIIKELN